tara:strand:- start:23282 stop:24385 length:1104 start_codon:yes stop_codon:yes gene_type:complete
MFINQNKKANHEYFMRLALNQAKNVLGNTKTNPAVGCVITKDNTLISAASTSINGRPHAEINALNFLKKKVKKANLYVTLEPCSHYGKTPPCTKSIIENKIKNVFFSVYDTDLRSYNKCAKLLRKKKINVYNGIYFKQAKNFYKSYEKFKINSFPFVTCKLAISKDFFTINKKKDWITNEFSRSRVQLMRSEHDCILTSSTTIAEDNPRLTCRIKGLESLSPSKIIIDRALKTPINSKIITNNVNRNTYIFYNKENKKKLNLFRNLGIKTFKVSLNKKGKMDLKQALIKINSLGFSRVFVESGLTLSSEFLKEKLVDDFKLCISNKKLKNKGKSNMKKYYNIFLKNKYKYTENINLYGDKILSFKIK